MHHNPVVGCVPSSKVSNFLDFLDHPKQIKHVLLPHPSKLQSRHSATLRPPGPCQEHGIKLLIAQEPLRIKLLTCLHELLHRQPKPGNSRHIWR